MYWLLWDENSEGLPTQNFGIQSMTFTLNWIAIAEECGRSGDIFNAGALVAKYVWNACLHKEKKKSQTPKLTESES